MESKEKLLDDILESNDLESIADLDFTATSLVTVTGKHIVAWCRDLTEDFGIHLLMLPYSVEYHIIEGERKIYLTRMNPYSEDIYHPIPMEMVMSVGHLNEGMLEVFEEAADEWLNSLTEEEPETAVVKEETNVVSFNPSKRLH
jgi:hypothetical protein